VLQVSTFPFLAVLLCTMGSLILLLLVIDRRAKTVARVKAQQARAAVVAEDAQAVAARQAEWEERRRLLHEQLSLQDQEVRTQAESLQKQEASSTTRIQTAQAEERTLQARLRAERSQLTATEEELLLRRKKLVQVEKETATSQAARAKLTAELARLEKTLADLKALRQRQQQMYSLVPYQGKHGDSRRPIYVECTATGVIFHPDRQTLIGPWTMGADLQTQIEKRLAAREKAYVLLLVRPEGITNYYRTIAALQKMNVDFGYEFIDADWVLDFPADDKQPAAQPWMTAKKSEGEKVSDRPPDAKGVKRPVIPYRGITAGNITGEQAGNGTTSSPGGASRLETGAMRAMAGNQSPRVGQMGGPSSGERTSSEQTRGGPSGVPDPSARAPGVGMPGMNGDRLASNGSTPSNKGPSPFASTARAGGSGEGSERSGAENSHTLNPSLSQGGHGEAAQRDPPYPIRRAPETASTQYSVPSTSETSTTPDSVLGTPKALSTQHPVPGSSETPSTQHSVQDTAKTPSTEYSVLSTADTQSTQRSVPGTSKSGTLPGPDSASAPSTQASQQAAAGTLRPRSEASADPDYPSESAAGLPRDAARALLGNAQKKPAPEKPRPLRWLGNRDWIIAIDCVADGLVLSATGQRVPLTALPSNDQGSNPLRESIQRMIARRQATVPAGEPPYRPMIRFRVHPDGWRAYYLAYPTLEALGVPMSRENLEQDDKKHSP
jgi:hypothetical protein